MDLWAKDALDTLITANASALISGLTIQGTAWATPQITREVVTAPKGNAPYIAIDIGSYWLSEFYTGQNQADLGETKYATVEYSVVVEAFWPALPKKDEGQVFEGMGADWDKFISRLVKVFYATPSFQDSTATHTFCLSRSGDPRSHRRIEVETLDNSGEDRPYWYSKIRFTLLQRCVDLSQL